MLLASAVLVAHGWYISGDGVGPQFAGENMGGWAVFGFFAISGYLITGSRLTKSLGHYLVHRVARIFPGFLVNLAVTAAVFAPASYWWTHRSIDGFLTTPTTPASYVFQNSTLRIYTFDVSGTPAGVPYPGAWNGSLWSLYYEFLCYAVIAVLGSMALFKKSPWALLATFAVTVTVFARFSWLAPYTQSNSDLYYLTKLLPFFLAGGILYMVRQRLVLTWPLAVLAALGTILLTRWQPVWGPQASGLLLAYVVLWAGAALPCPDIIRRHDISYGVYIYAFPVQQLLAIAGADRWNLAVFDIVALAATIPFATASWLLVERPVMMRARASTASIRPPGKERPAMTHTGDEQQRGSLDPIPASPGGATAPSRPTRADNT